MSCVEWEFKNNQYQPKQTTMEKPKFASVKLKSLNWKLEFQDTGLPCWAYCPVEGYPVNLVRFAEQYILANPDYFEVTYPERLFEEGAYYKAKDDKSSAWEVIKFRHCKFFRSGTFMTFTKNDFYEIGDKIEL